MKRMTYFVMALALVLGLAQCKKEQIEPQNEGDVVMITLNVGSDASTGSATDGSKAEVTPPHVSFEEGDTILVASGGKYAGYLTKNETNFSGGIPAENLVVNEPLYFYFLGNKIKMATLTSGSTQECTVNISNQTDYPHLPVIAMGRSIDPQTGKILKYVSGMTSFTSCLYNKASLMKFNVTTSSTAAICITGMNNEVTVNFNPETEDERFEYGMDGDGVIKMHGVTTENTETWAIVLPQDELSVGEEGSVYTDDNAYIGTRPAMDEIVMNTYINSGFALEVTTAAVVENIVDLSTISTETYPGGYTLEDGDVLTGTLDGANDATKRVKISIADGATITLRDAHVLGYYTIATDATERWAGLNCIGDATIILDDGTENEVQGSYYAYPGIHIPANKTLIINANGTGSGTLDARCLSTEYCGGAGIGAIANNNTTTDNPCGNIVINGGIITASGACAGGSEVGGPGIGGARNASCGTITINGGTVTAQGGRQCPGIGTGSPMFSGGVSNCGAVIINGGVVEAIAGYQAAGIGSGTMGGYDYKTNCHCESVTITGGMVTAKGGKYGAGIGSGYCTGTRTQPKSSCGNVTITGGTVIAEGGDSAAGIGSGYKAKMGTSQCGNITIETGVTKVTAKKGGGTGTFYCIGIGKSGACGTISIGGDDMGAGVVPNQDDGLTYIYEP
jgi:hypothetical protein